MITTIPPIAANHIALANCIERAGLPPAPSYAHAIAWACSSWVNRLEVQAEALRLIGIDPDPELYQEALERARTADAARIPH